MNDGLITFESVRDWEARECQRHICEIQGLERCLSLFGRINLGSRARFRAKVDGFVPETQHVNFCIVGDWETRHICEIQGQSRFTSLLS